MKEIIGMIFSMGLMINAGLFVVQAVKIVRARSSRGVSIFTFAGFSLLQITGILHGIFQQDWYLLAGMATSFVACTTVVVLSIIYRKGTASTAREDPSI
jgi:MtN3 and saliva related transmembrane protein